MALCATYGMGWWIGSLIAFEQVEEASFTKGEDIAPHSYEGYPEPQKQIFRGLGELQQEGGEKASWESILMAILLLSAFM